MVQNDAGTRGQNWHKSDTADSANVPHENEKPGAAATATGSISFQQFTSEEYRNRAEAATALCHAIANCDPDDAAQIMSSVLIELSAGMPIAPFHGVMEQAAFWADLATPPELDAYALACVNRMAPARRAAFLAYVGGLQ